MAFQSLLFLGREVPGATVSPRVMAEQLGCSPGHMSKILEWLVRADILASSRGARGGVRLARPPAAITMLEVAEACQGRLVANFCTPPGGESAGCSYHDAVREIHGHLVATLTRWTLADLLRRPARCEPGLPRCRMCFQECREGGAPPSTPN